MREINFKGNFTVVFKGNKSSTGVMFLDDTIKINDKI
jgi:hypothetical protein